MDNKTIDMNEIIIRYLDRSASTEDARELLLWIKQSDKNWNEFNQIRDLWLSCDGALSDETGMNLALDRLRSRISTMHTLKQTSKRHFSNWYHAAAIIFILLGIGFGYSLNRSKPSEKDIYIQNQLITAIGSKGKFLLPDGSTVWLNSESKLIYPETFDPMKRIVRLEGEGYFEIKENRKQPFIVQSGDLEVEVLGTTFDISGYSFNEKTDVVLLSGSVKVMSEMFEKEVVMEPGQLLSYWKRNKEVQIQPTKVHLHVDWIKERLSFDNERLSDIIISLGGWYNTSIHCSSSFAENTRMTFTIRGENLEETLKAMSLIIPIRYTISDHRVTITPK